MTNIFIYSPAIVFVLPISGLLDVPNCGALVRVVAALLAFEVDLGVAPWRRSAVIALAFEAFVRGPGVDEGAVHAEVFVAGEFVPLGAALDAFEEYPGQVFIEGPVAVGAEGEVVPDLVFDVQA